MRADCPRCGLRFEREEGFFLGAFVINLAITQLALIVFIAVAIVATLPDPPMVLLALEGVAVAIAVPLLGYPFSKTTWAAIDLLMHPR